MSPRFPGLFEAFWLFPGWLFGERPGRVARALTWAWRAVVLAAAGAIAWMELAVIWMQVTGAR